MTSPRWGRLDTAHPTPSLTGSRGHGPSVSGCLSHSAHCRREEWKVQLLLDYSVVRNLKTVSYTKPAFFSFLSFDLVPFYHWTRFLLNSLRKTAPPNSALLLGIYKIRLWNSHGKMFSMEFSISDHLPEENYTRTPKTRAS